MCARTLADMTAEEVATLIRGPTHTHTHTGMTAEEVAPLIRGPVGSKVQLEILRPGGSKTQMVTLTRIKIEQSGPAPKPERARPESKSVTGERHGQGKVYSLGFSLL